MEKTKQKSEKKTWTEPVPQLLELFIESDSGSLTKVHGFESRSSSEFYVKADSEKLIESAKNVSWLKDQKLVVKAKEA